MEPLFAKGKIINLTQHPASDSQIASGVVDLSGQLKEKMISMITFSEIPSREDLEQRAFRLSIIAEHTGATNAMIGGAPFFQEPLSGALRNKGITPLFSFTLRKAKEEHMPDGTVRKFGVFEHLGFVEGFAYKHLIDRNPPGWEKAG